VVPPDIHEVPSRSVLFVNCTVLVFASACCGLCPLFAFRLLLCFYVAILLFRVLWSKLWVDLGGQRVTQSKKECAGLLKKTLQTTTTSQKMTQIVRRKASKALPRIPVLLLLVLLYPRRTLRTQQDGISH
jgi:hypothetical protein